MQKENKGYEIENRMMKFFKGVPSDEEDIDFETSKYVYEVKSCNLFNKTKNQNSKRKNKSKDIISAQLGRFIIRPTNHIGLFLHAIQKGKTPKYIFVLTSKKQIIFKILKWEDIKVSNSKDYYYVKLIDIFFTR